MEPLETVILQFTDNQHTDKNQENIFKNYSFGREVYRDFIKRRDKIKKALGLNSSTEFRMVGAIKNKNEKKQYVLETAIGFNSELSSNLLTVINFLNDIIENTQKTLNDKKCQDNFKEAAFLLKKNKIETEEAFKLKDEFQKKYKFSEYLFYNPKDAIIGYHGWEDNKSVYENASALKEDIGLISPLNSTLLMLNNKGLIDFDYSYITKLKEQYRKKFFSLIPKKSIAFYKKIVEEEQKIEHPLFSITKETSFKDVIEILQENELLNYFPFSSRFDTEFLAYALREHFKKEK